MREDIKTAQDIIDRAPTEDAVKILKWAEQIIVQDLHDVGADKTSSELECGNYVYKVTVERIGKVAGNKDESCTA